MKVIFTDEADRDRHRVWMFQATRSIEHADRVDARFEQRVASLGGLPRQGRAVSGDLRRLSIPDIQLVVHYRIDDDAIRILSVWHTRENREQP